MKTVKENLLRVATFCFLAGVAFLIVRNNGYPWIIKRASDVLFLISGLVALGHVIAYRKWTAVWNVLRELRTGALLILAGVTVATAYAFFAHGVRLDSEGVLMFARLLEVLGLAVLVGILRSQNPDLLRKFSIAQLSTIAYLPTLFLEQETIKNLLLDRFHLFENWPSNVSYYLLVSLAIVLVPLLRHLSPPTRQAIPYAALAIGFSGLLLWTQVRASWLVFGLLSFFIPLLIAQRALTGKVSKFCTSLTVIILVVIIGFAALPRLARNLVLLRPFPTYEGIDFYTQSTAEIVANIRTQEAVPTFRDPSRLTLWGDYFRALLREPIGFGLSYFPKLAATYHGKPMGPHNTFLEITALGGVLALLGFLLLTGKALLRSVARFRAAPTDLNITLLVALAALFAVTFFDNMSAFRLLWLLVGFGIFA